MQVADLKLPGLKLVTSQIFQDDRGFFFESYRQSRFTQQGIDATFVQDNVSFSRRGTVRGLHFQPHQKKLVLCVQGTIWDVVVDIRPESPAFMQWEAVELDDQNHKQLFIPEGFAHGFCVLSPTARVHYKVSVSYDPEAERSIRWNDPDFKIAWPLQDPILSPRDQLSPFFKEFR